MDEDLETLKRADPFDKAFIDYMTMHHETAIAAAKIALEKSRRAEIKDMAEKMIDAQADEVDQMKRWRSAWYPSG